MAEGISSYSRPIVWYPSNPAKLSGKVKPGKATRDLINKVELSYKSLENTCNKLDLLRKQQLEIRDEIGKLAKKIGAAEENLKVREGYIPLPLEKKENACFVFKIMSVLKKCLFNLFCVHLDAVRKCSYGSYRDDSVFKRH